MEVVMYLILFSIDLEVSCNLMENVWIDESIRFFMGWNNEKKNKIKNVLVMYCIVLFVIL